MFSFFFFGGFSSGYLCIILKKVPNRLGKLPRLKSFFGYGNQFAQFPDMLCDLKSLEILNLGRNRLILLPKTTKKWENLQFWDLYDNLLTKLPVEIG
jgi:Leucine-rich repeat (LRR) protein